MSSDDHDDAWKQEIAGVKPLKNRPAMPIEKAPPPPKNNNTPKAHPMPNRSSGKPLPPIAQGDFSSIATAAIRKLKRGKFPISGTLDLHGMKQDAAYSALESFIHRHVSEAQTLVLIVTGKGGINNPSILKTNLPNWLNMPAIRPCILCFDHASQAHGGSGAFYVLLRKKSL